MLVTESLYLLLIGCGIFVVGTVVGSFLNVCIYRIPWEKSVIWPGSSCPHCRQPIAAQDNIPIMSWLALRGECRNCGASISGRYPLVELTVGLLFLAAFLVDVIHGSRVRWGFEIGRPLATLVYHAVFIALLVTAAFIDYDLFIIPDAITIPGMVFGVAVGAFLPWVRPEPSDAVTHSGGFGIGILGLLIGAGFTECVRRIAGFCATFLASLFAGEYTPREAMGFGDVTLMGMIGAFLGWQAALLTFFIGPFFGIAQAVWKMIIKVKKLVTGQKLSSLDRELPFGPYLSLGALTMVLTWPWLWPGWGKRLFETLGWLFWSLLGVNAPFPE